MAKSCYVAGPMRGIPEFNFPAFFEAEATLTAAGWEVFNPAREDMQVDPGASKLTEEEATANFAQYMERDLALVCRADAVVVLPGWERSQGARLEVHVARETGKEVLEYPLLHPVEFVPEDAFPPQRELNITSIPWTDGEAPKAFTDEIMRIFVDELEPFPVQGPAYPGGYLDFAEGKAMTTDESTGGQKEMSLARLGLLPVGPLLELSKVFGYGAAKYADHNYRKGYAVSKSFDALLRHGLAAMAGQDRDPESGRLHLAHAAWHCLAIIDILHHHPEMDDRFKELS